MSAPYVLRPRFLAKEMRDAIFSFLRDTSALFEPARTNEGLLPKMRRSLFRANCLHELDEAIAVAFERAIAAALEGAFMPLGVPRFLPTFTELHGLIYRDGDFFRLHNDCGPNNTRVVTFVYTLHEEPGAFTGAELILYDRSGSTRIPSEDNRLLLFPSEVFHEVTRLEGAGARYAINGWFHHEVSAQHQ